MNWENDNQLFAMMKEELYSAVIGDILDEMGRYHQFLPQYIQPLRDDMLIAGRAMPVLEADAFGTYESSKSPVMNKPFGLMLEALDSLQENEVYICTGSSHRYALWGELMSTRAQILKAAGAVVDGFSRDTKGILDLDFPTFSKGRYAQDQGPRGRVVDYRVPIEMDGVLIKPGDIVFGDMDGVVIVPQEIEREVIERSYQKATGEKMVAEQIRGGMPAKESYDRYGIM